jgi:transcriptional regulator with PAS, ATPase and Fis domain
MALTIDDVARQIIHDPTSPMASLIQSLSRIAPTQANVLVMGESGVGKENIVRAIHDLAPWGNGPFVPINCGAIPENLLESELFGYAKGAFTGADRSRQGRFDAARGGTLFLDEIGEMPIGLQVKLLRVLQEKEFEPLGSTEKRRAEFRIVAATNRDLEETVVSGTFRQDLFFRLDVVRIEVPSLRDRPMDIRRLSKHFLDLYKGATLGNVTDFTDGALEMLERHEWPGNVRELENVVHSMLVLKDSGALSAQDVAAKIQGRILSASPRTFGAIELPLEGINLRDALEKMEQQLIRQALVRSSGNKAAAATLLGINRTTLVEKLKRNPIDLGELVDPSSD